MTKIRPGRRTATKRLSDSVPTVQPSSTPAERTQTGLENGAVNRSAQNLVEPRWAGFFSSLKTKMLGSRLAKLLKQHPKQAEHFCSPVIAGLVTSAGLHLADRFLAEPAGVTSRAISFIDSALKHVHAEVILLGLFLLSMCMALIGSPLAHLVKVVVVRPLIQLSHHVTLLGAGAALAAFIGALASGEGAGTIFILLLGTLLLLIGGAEMQAADEFSRLSDEELKQHLPIPVISFLGIVMTGIFGAMLVNALRHAH